MEGLRYWRDKGGGLDRVFCMQGGEDDVSYAKNSEATASAIKLCKPFFWSAIQWMRLSFDSDNNNKVIRIADLGCATGSNTLATVDMIVQALKESYEDDDDLEFEALFCDLPCNDFNSLFRSLPHSNYYAAGVPGSFYGRLFPSSSLHVAVSLSALHWLSQIPEQVMEKRSKAWNKGRVWIEGAKEEVVEAYAKQSEKDFDDFMTCRKQEIAKGGLLFLLMGGRPISHPPCCQLGDAHSSAKHPFTTSMDQAWQDLINEGLIEEERRDGFNIPAYMRSVVEVERGIKKSGGFEIKRIEYHRIEEFSKEKHSEWLTDPLSYARAKANLVRATLRPFLEAHLGPFLSHQLFNRFETRVSSDFSLHPKTCFYGVIVVSAIRI